MRVSTTIRCVRDRPSEIRRQRPIDTGSQPRARCTEIHARYLILLFFPCSRHPAPIVVSMQHDIGTGFRIPPALPFAVVPKWQGNGSNDSRCASSSKGSLSLFLPCYTMHYFHLSTVTGCKWRNF